MEWCKWDLSRGKFPFTCMSLVVIIIILYLTTSLVKLVVAMGWCRPTVYCNRIQQMNGTGLESQLVEDRQVGFVEGQPRSWTRKQTDLTTSWWSVEPGNKPLWPLVVRAVCDLGNTRFQVQGPNISAALPSTQSNRESMILVYSHVGIHCQINTPVRLLMCVILH